MNRETKTMLKLVRKNLVSIDDAARVIAKKWDTNAIPLTTFKEIVKNAKPSTDEPKLQQFVNQWQDTLDNLYNTCETIAKKNKSEKVPVDVIRQATSIIYVNFEKRIMES